MRMRKIIRLVAELCGGAKVSEAAEEAYAISRNLGIPVDIIHNDKRYTVSLEAEESTREVPKSQHFKCPVCGQPVDSIGRHSNTEDTSSK